MVCKAQNEVFLNPLKRRNTAEKRAVKAVNAKHKAGEGKEGGRTTPLPSPAHTATQASKPREKAHTLARTINERAGKPVVGKSHRSSSSSRHTQAPFMVTNMFSPFLHWAGKKRRAVFFSLHAKLQTRVWQVR